MVKEVYFNMNLLDLFGVQSLPQAVHQIDSQQKLMQAPYVKREHRFAPSRWFLFLLHLLCAPQTRAPDYQNLMNSERCTFGYSWAAPVLFSTLGLLIAPPLYAADVPEPSVQSIREANLASLGTPPQKRMVALTIPSLQVDFFNQMKESVDAEAKAKGVDLIVADAKDDPAMQVDQIKNMIIRGVNAVICIPVDLEAVGNELKAVKKANISVINVEREALDAPGDTLIATDEFGAAMTLGEYVCKVTSGKANVGVIQGPPGFEFTMNCDKGFSHAIANCPGLRVVVKQPSHAWMQDEGLNIAQDMLQAFPDINALFCETNALALGAAHAVKRANIGNKVWIFGFYGDVAGLEAVRAGTLDATMIQKTQYIGKLAMDSALDLIDGKHLPKEQLQEAILTTSENVGFLLRNHP
jgi:ribose transport system substrate-binding protein